MLLPSCMQEEGYITTPVDYASRTKCLFQRAILVTIHMLSFPSAFEDACSEGAVQKVAQILKQTPAIVDETFSLGDPPIVA